MISEASARNLLWRRWYTSRITNGESSPAVIAAILALATIYFISSKLGFSMAHAAEQITVVWPPSGIALAALLLLGFRMWPGIAFGAFLTNLTNSEPIAAAAGIAVGNTLEALAGAWMLRRFVGFDNRLPRIRDVAGLAIFAACFSTMISATLGVISLCMGGVQPWESFTSMWTLWWVGDATGILIFTPILLIIGATPGVPGKHPGIDEELALIIGLSITCVLVFIQPHAVASFIRQIFVYLIFPFIVWSGLRFGHFYTTLATLVVSCLAAWATTQGLGPFTTASTEMNLFLLQIFMAALAMTGLLLGAAVKENDELVQQQHAVQSVSQILNTEHSSHDTIFKAIQSLGICSKSDYVTFWLVEPQENTIRCIETWCNPALQFPGLDEATRNKNLLPGTEMAGVAWLRKLPLWLGHLALEAGSRRADTAVREGLYGAFIFPIIHHNRVVAVMEFFSHAAVAPDKHSLGMFSVSGNMVAQFLETVRTKQALSASEARNSIFS